MVSTLETDIITCNNDFFEKEYNEPLIKNIMSAAYQMGKWISGDPNKHEPDQMNDGDWYEFTLAANEEFVHKAKKGLNKEEFSFNDILNLILKAAERKSHKHYAYKPSLCIFAPIYGQFKDKIDIKELFPNEFYFNLKQNYVNNNTFVDIFVIVYLNDELWGIYDVKKQSVYDKLKIF